MIVELLDYRPQQRNKEAAPDKPERTRVVLHPNGETLFADICALNRKNGNKWTDRDALEVEARILVSREFRAPLQPVQYRTARDLPTAVSGSGSTSHACCESRPESIDSDCA
jgi:transcription factor SPT20